MKLQLYKSHNSGFTIIEVLIALAIFSVGLLAMGALQSSTLKQTGDIGRKTEAWSVLEDQVERLKELQFYTNVSAQTFPADLTSGNHSESRKEGRFTVDWNITDNTPIDEVTIPDDLLLANVPSGTYTVSKTITVEVAEFGSNDTIAEVAFVKTWAVDGME
ncbi:prepilin-type N-terminal cleavage/methylation domain-containing protein [Desulfosalsimonas propionicica]|uniref:Prepilin-type N-terminal cleavage/methylation domain-containing protein n=1 Tax=Desulfosalsimonas propionicica TaxID=332175 RepID=A0A7W0HJX2_9BACT|nr:prepilin-type N-terminal cleavage/methylation domain-containing protein [Desulfosalsimonas propionicica]MBA2880640.1 prepilin-type N-terminal cleavage/methylation domain-containing protein [Desulfosalsimonas propionicica]